MKKTKKGLTLVEVLVGITVFSIVIFALFTAVASMRKIVFRQEEYVKIKMVCYDIDAYHKKYSNEWMSKYFNNGEPINEDIKVGYLTSKFKPTSNENEAAYTINFEYYGDDNNNLIITSITTKDLKRTFVENLDLSKIGKSN